MENSTRNGSANGLSLPFYDLLKDSTGPFGQVKIESLTGNGFHIRHIHFHIISPSQFLNSSSGINLIASWQSKCSLLQKDEELNALKFQQYKFIAGPFCILLNKPGIFEAFNIELSDTFLAPYIQLCPQLLQTIPRFITLDMIYILNKAIGFVNTSEYSSLRTEKISINR